MDHCYQCPQLCSLLDSYYRLLCRFNLVLHLLDGFLGDMGVRRAFFFPRYYMDVVFLGPHEVFLDPAGHCHCSVGTSAIQAFLGLSLAVFEIVWQPVGYRQLAQWHTPIMDRSALKEAEASRALQDTLSQPVVLDLATPVDAFHAYVLRTLQVQ